MKYRIKKFINILRARYNAIKIGGIKRLFKSDRKNRKFLSRRKQKQKYGAGFLTRRTYIKTELAKRDGRC